MKLQPVNSLGVRSIVLAPGEVVHLLVGMPGHCWTANIAWIHGTLECGCSHCTHQLTKLLHRWVQTRVAPFPGDDPNNQLEWQQSPVAYAITLQSHTKSLTYQIDAQAFEMVFASGRAKVLEEVERERVLADLAAAKSKHLPKKTHMPDEASYSHLPPYIEGPDYDDLLAITSIYEYKDLPF